METPENINHHANNKPTREAILAQRELLMVDEQHLLRGIARDAAEGRRRLLKGELNMEEAHVLTKLCQVAASALDTLSRIDIFDIDSCDVQ